MKKWMWATYEGFPVFSQLQSVCYPTLTSASAPISLRDCSVGVSERRMDDRIRAVCARLKDATEGGFETLLQELLELVHQKNARLKRRAARLLLKGEPLEPERRASMLLGNTKNQEEPV
jgi:hypothetical protein